MISDDGMSRQRAELRRLALDDLMISALLYEHRVALALGLYCTLYCAPLFAMVVLTAVLSSRADALFGHVRMGVDWALARLLAPITSMAGIALIVDGLSRLYFQLRGTSSINESEAG
jgi:hypothetical protein